MWSKSSQQSLAQIVLILNERKCPWMPVSSFMTANNVALFYDRSLGTAVFIVPTETPSVRPFRRATGVAPECRLLAGNGYKNLLILALIPFRSPPGSGH